jgi:hypothetical protein
LQRQQGILRSIALNKPKSPRLIISHLCRSRRSIIIYPEEDESEITIFEYLSFPCEVSTSLCFSIVDLISPCSQRDGLTAWLVPLFSVQGLFVIVIGWRVLLVMILLIPLTFVCGLGALFCACCFLYSSGVPRHSVHRLLLSTPLSLSLSLSLSLARSLIPN